MPRLVVTSRVGDELLIEGTIGKSVMEAIRSDPKSELLAICGGCMSCGTCHIYLEGGPLHHVPAPSEDEIDMLDALLCREPTSRLSCQIVFSDALDGLRVTLAPEE